MNSMPAASPCPSKQSALMEFVFGALPPARADELQAHLKQCDACRGYVEELTALSNELREAGASLPEAEADETFHRRVRAQIRNEPAIHLMRCPRTVRTIFAGALVAAACVTLALVLFLPTNRPAPASFAHIGTDASSAPAMSFRSPPTWKSYQRAANASLETLDAVIDSQGAGSAAASPADAPVVYALGRRSVDE